MRRRKEEQSRERKGEGRRIEGVVVGGKEGREEGWKGTERAGRESKGGAETSPPPVFFVW